LLQIKTVDVADSEAMGKGLLLNKDTSILKVSNAWDWYIVEKAKNAKLFKVVGLHKSILTLNHVFALGNEDGKPYLMFVSNNVEASLNEKEILDIVNKTRS
jgi:hypothetical protein